MSTLLAAWLDSNRPSLLARWQARLSSMPDAGGADGAPASPGPPDAWLALVYDALRAAAQGDLLPLEACLARDDGPRAGADRDRVHRQLTALFAFRQAAWEAIPAGNAAQADTADLLDALNSLVDRAAIILATQSADEAAAAAQKLQQTELLVTSMAALAEQADRVALQLSNLNAIGRSLASHLEPAYVIDAVGGKLVETLDIAHASFWLPGSEGQLSVAQNWGMANAQVGRVSVDAATDLIVRAYLSGEMVFAATLNPDEQGDWYHAGWAGLAAPLIAHEQVIGVIVVQDPRAEACLGPAQQHFIESVASQAAIALENARLYAAMRDFNAVLEQRIAERTHALRTEHAMLETLHQIALEVSSTLDLDLLLHNCLARLADLIGGVEHGSIMLIEPDTDHLVDRAILGSRGGPSGRRRFPVGQGIAGWVAQHRQAALVDNVLSDARWIDLPVNDAARKQSGSLIAVPLLVQHEVTGVLVLSHPAVGYFNETHLRLLGAAAGVIALSVHNAMLYDHIQHQLMRQGEMLRRERRATTQSAAILQSLSDGVIVCDTEGAVLTANPAVERILYRSIEELLTWRLPELLARVFGARSKDIPVEELLAHPLDAQGVARHYAADLQIGAITVRLTLDPVIASRGEMMGAVIVFRNITREVESERLKDEFIGTVSHELRTPMTSIKGFTQLLAMGSLGPVTETQREFLNTIHTNAEHMISIINDLLDITKIEAGSIELDSRPLHCAEALGRVVLELQASIAARQHELVINIPAGLPLVSVDAQRFDQILMHLLSNAIKYTPQGGRITVDAREITEAAVPERLREGLRPGRYVQIEICDTGVGIAPAEHALIFKRFYRTENPLKIEAGGTGLGLALVRPLIHLFGGRIWVQSEVNNGSTFSFVVPVAT